MKIYKLLSCGGNWNAYCEACVENSDKKDTHSMIPMT
jgi:hypothetical protein